MHPMSEDRHEAWARRFDLLGDPTRLRLLDRMHHHPGSTVGELAEAADITQATASQSLRTLRQQGWVQATRDGRSMRYRLVDDTAHELLHVMGADHHSPSSGVIQTPGHRTHETSERPGRP